MERIIQGRSATLTQTFQSDGVATDPSPDTATVTITRDDGTTVVSGAAATEAGTGKVTYTVTPVQTALLDGWTVTWAATFGGQAQTFKQRVEVAGDALFSIAQAKALMPTASTADLVDARTYAETELEGAIGYALVPRYSRETITGTLRLGTYTRVRWPNIRAVREVIVNGNALTAGELADLTFNQHFIVGWSLLTTASWRNDVVIVGYEHGLDSPPPGANRAALALATDYLGGDTSGSSIDPRAESVITVDGTIRLRSGAGQFAALGVNEWVAANRLPAVA